MLNGTILLIDDEAVLRQVVARTLELKGYTVRQAPDAMRGLELLRDFAAEILVVLSDVKLPDGRGLDLLTRYKALAPLAEVVLMTAYGTIADGVRAMKEGAFDYLTKGDADDQLMVVVDRAAEKARLQRRMADLEKKVGVQYSFDSMIGHAPALEQAKKLAQRAAPTDSTVLLEEASGGTIFLDEIGELELNVQAKFLRVLETRQFTKLGDTRPTSADVRIVAATNRNLRQEAEAGNFRPDLYYRLAVFTVPVPGLNERRDDVPELADYFLQFFAAKLRRCLRGLGPDVLAQLRAHDWRGNVRELKNVQERAAILADGDTLTVDDLPSEFHHILPAPGLDEATDRTLRTQEKRQIRQVLLDTGGNKM